MPRLTEQQYFELQTQYERTPSLNESFGASGEHMMLINVLRKCGVIAKDRYTAMDIAEALLAEGWK